MQRQLRVSCAACYSVVHAFTNAFNNNDLRTDIEPSDCVYRLTGVVCHGGSLLGGHYSSYVLHDGFKPSAQNLADPALWHATEGGEFPQWYYHNDTRFRLATAAEVLKRQAYMLCYTKVSALATPSLELDTPVDTPGGGSPPPLAASSPATASMDEGDGQASTAQAPYGSDGCIDLTARGDTLGGAVAGSTIASRPASESDSPRHWRPPTC